MSNVLLKLIKALPQYSPMMSGGHEPFARMGMMPDGEWLHRKSVMDILGEHPAHPAIPMDVRETLMARLKDGNFFLADLHPLERDRRFKAARDWLAKCPEAMDKAVCPKCGTSFDPSDGEGMFFESATCPECEHEFDIEVVINVISPPREPKGEDNSPETCVSCGKAIPEDKMHGQCHINGKLAHYECVTRYARNVLWRDILEPKVTPVKNRVIETLDAATKTVEQWPEWMKRPEVSGQTPEGKPREPKVTP